MNYVIFLLATEEAGGLFDLNATLPLMAIQVLLLAAVLNAVFYKPLSQAIDERDGYVRENNQQASERLDKAKQLAEQYEQQLAEARRDSQATVMAGRESGQKAAAQQVADAQKEVQQMREQASAEIEQQKQAALSSLEAQVNAISSQIVQKILG